MAELKLRDGHTLRYADLGAGPVLLLAHGFTGCGRTWGSELLDTLARAHRVLVPDLIGHGDSSPCEEAKRYELSENANDLVELLDTCGVQQATWIGYSMGGRVALGAATRFSERMSGLILEGASPGLADPEERAARVHSDEELARRIETEPLSNFVDFWMGLPLFASQKRIGARRLLEAREQRLHNSPRALAACLRGLGTGQQPSFWDQLDQVDLPVLLLAGEEDPKFREIGAQMCSALPDARQKIVPRSGHTTHLEHPEAWLSEVCEFVASDASRRSL